MSFFDNLLLLSKAIFLKTFDNQINFKIPYFFISELVELNESH